MKNKNALTLLEMSMVLTVIGLIIGGVLIGVSLIRAAQIQSIISDEDRYKKAITLFKEKYKYLPGDMSTATNFWGTDVGCPTTPYTINEAVAKTTTCNGDGDGKIDTPYESWRAWQQLANAGFIDGAYSGIQANNNPVTGPYTITAGKNVPASKLPKCGWMIGYISSGSSTSGNYTVTINQGATFLQLTSAGPDLWYPGCLAPAESASIDTKIDDGMPLTGNMIEGGSQFLASISVGLFLAPSWQTSGMDGMYHATKYPCTTNTSPNYNVSNSSTTACDPFFNLGF